MHAQAIRKQTLLVIVLFCLLFLLVSETLGVIFKSLFVLDLTLTFFILAQKAIVFAFSILFLFIFIPILIFFFSSLFLPPPLIFSLSSHLPHSFNILLHLHFLFSHTFKFLFYLFTLSIISSSLATPYCASISWGIRIWLELLLLEWISIFILNCINLVGLLCTWVVLQVLSFAH